MAGPVYEVAQWNYENDDAQNGPLHIPVVLLCNTPDEQLNANIYTNTRKPLRWLAQQPEREENLILVGGGPSVSDHLADIMWLKKQGGKIIAINAASKWLTSKGLEVDYQLTCDAKDETATLIDPKANDHLFASQVSPLTMDRVSNPIVYHLDTPGCEDQFPSEKRKRGGYALFNGSASSGVTALPVGYGLGFRKFHIFGYDSSNRAEKTHAYAQDMNKVIPNMTVNWCGTEYTASITMKAQAERFQIMAQHLQHLGCTIDVYGNGLLQHMWRTKGADLDEKAKYKRMWQFDQYRYMSPAEQLVGFIDAHAPERGCVVVDFGCGTGRAMLELTKRGFHVIGVDFADNCRDEAAKDLPFLEWDLSLPCPLRAPYGYCCDVMEHIPPDQVDAVLSNIKDSAETVVFRIEYEPDVMGKLIGVPLHLSVHPEEWWLTKLAEHFSSVESYGQGTFKVKR
jgi:hypothetical protein